VIFDDDHAVANAGLVPPATLAPHLGIEAVVNGTVDLGVRPAKVTVNCRYAAARCA